MKISLKILLLLLIVVYVSRANAQSYANLRKLTRETTIETYSEAADKFSKIIKKSKKDENVYVERYFFYLKFKEYDLALKDINKAIALASDKYLLYEYRADLYLQMDSLEESYKDINIMYKMDATIPDAHIFKGQYFRQKDSIELAFQSFDKAITIYESNNAPCYVMSRCYAGRGSLNMALGNIEKAIADFTKAIAKARDSKRDNLYTLRARAYFLKNNRQSGLKDIDAALAYNPDSITLGYIHSISGNIDSVEAIIPNLIAKKLNTVCCKEDVRFYNISCYYSILNKKEKAIEYLEKSLQLGYDKFNWIQIDYDMKNIKNSPEFIALIEKYKNTKQN